MNTWRLQYQEWRPEEQSLREALCTLGNGYFATRGAAEESGANDTHYPGTYLASGYNRLQSEINGKTIENEDLVNWPNWLCLTFRIEGEDWFNLQEVNVQDFDQVLDVQQGLLERKLTFTDAQGRSTSLLSRRFVSMNDEHIAGIQWVLKAENWSGNIEIQSGIDGSVHNWGVKRYRDLSSQHLEILEKGTAGKDGIYLKVQTVNSRIEMAQAARTQIFVDNDQLETTSVFAEKSGFVSSTFYLNCEQAKPLVIEKIVAIYTSRDWAIAEAGHEARKAISRAGRFEDLLAKHSRSWAQLWSRCDIEIAGQDYAQMVLRLHIFHLLQTASFKTIDLDAGIPARGWHGEAYRGHIFWDELFIFPFLNMRIPDITRELLMYRYRRLREARYIAREAGCKGACFPWQSGSNGSEETQKLHLNPKSGKWIPDNTYLQRHINLAIAYNIWQYYQASGDMEFMSYYGVRMMLEIAWFLATLATWNEERQKYEILGVVGPDEYHTQFPGSDSPGLDNNAYTNIMTSWVLQRVEEALELLTERRKTELLETMGLSKDEIARWKEVSSKLFIPFHNGNIISQFEGYERLKEFNWDEYIEKYGNNMRLDRILDAEGDSVENYQASKQADVLMLFYLLTTEDLKKQFEHMGYPLDYGLIPENISYYSERTSHGSTLSQLVHSWVLARGDRQQSWHYFEKALRSDIEDVQGGTTAEGIHLGAMAGTVDLIQRGYTGMEIRDDVLWFNPSLPEQLKHIKMNLCYRGHWFNLLLTHQKLEIYFEESLDGKIRIGFQGKVYESEVKQTLTFNL
jgi:trehalose/maltose hydrolase-like predicted phosphorylase